MNGKLYIQKVVFSAPFEEKTYLTDIPAVRFLMQQELMLKKKVTFFVGENGSGKSTLMEAIATAFGFNPEGGTRNFTFATANTHSELCEHITLVKKDYPQDGFFLRAESFYNMAGYIDEVKATHNYGGVSLHNQSHGESFLALVQNRFSGNGLYILDEPESALSPMRLLTLLSEIHRLAQNNSQFIIATHSPILMAYPGAQILQFSEAGIEEVAYEQTEHYAITKAFLNAPEKYVHYLLSGQ